MVSKKTKKRISFGIIALFVFSIIMYGGISATGWIYAGGIELINPITEFSTDNTFSDESDSAVPTEKAIVDGIATTDSKLRTSMLSSLGISEAINSWENTNSNPDITVQGDIEDYIKRIRVVTLNDDGAITQDDQQPIGYPEYPEFTFGANLGFQWKNLDLSMSWAGATLTSRMLGETYRVAFGATQDRSLLQYMAEGRWTPETANEATYPRMTLIGQDNNTKDSDFWLRDASYLRLKNMEVGYNFSGSLLKRFGISNLRAFLNGYNLLTFDSLDITDPETRPGSRSTYPLTKIYNVGFKLNF